MIAKVSTFFRAHPMLKGMAVYSVIWPTSSVVQQLINSEDLDWKKSLRFFMFGTFFVAPTLYGWIKITTAMWPQMNLKTGMQKAILEQVKFYQTVKFHHKNFNFLNDSSLTDQLLGYHFSLS